jgi:[ribosomal protein S5]-alanine N-acetyltransferase
MLTGKLVMLAPLGVDEVTDDYVSWFNDPETFRYLGSKFGQTHASIRDYIKQVQAPNLMARIIRREDMKHVGNLALQDFDPVNRRMELGIVIGAADARGKGLGREACSLVIQHAFDHLNVHKITAGTVIDNAAMTKVFTELGFAIEGTLREHYYLEGGYKDMLRFGLLQREFKIAHQ